MDSPCLGQITYKLSEHEESAVAPASTLVPDQGESNQANEEEEWGFRVSVVRSRRIQSQQLTKTEIIRAKNTIIQAQQKRIARLMSRCSMLEQRRHRAQRVAALVTETLQVALAPIVEVAAPASSS
jgi:hypothetical protein